MFAHVLGSGENQAVCSHTFSSSSDIEALSTWFRKRHLFSFLSNRFSFVYLYSVAVRCLMRNRLLFCVCQFLKARALRAARQRSAWNLIWRTDRFRRSPEKARVAWRCCWATAYFISKGHPSHPTGVHENYKCFSYVSRMLTWLPRTYRYTTL